MSSPYTELVTTSNFSFLQSGSHPEELVEKAALLGYTAIAITDYHSVAGIVRAHTAAQSFGIPYIVGCRLAPHDVFGDIELTAYPTTRAAYGALCRGLTQGKRRAAKGECLLSLDEILSFSHDSHLIIIPRCLLAPRANLTRLEGTIERIVESIRNPSLLSLGFLRGYAPCYRSAWLQCVELSKRFTLTPCAIGDVLYHAPERRALHDVVTCIRHGVTIDTAGNRLQANAERYLHTRDAITRWYRDLPAALTRTIEITSDARGFSLTQLHAEYPEEVTPGGMAPREYLRSLVVSGAHNRYPDGVPPAVQATIEHELTLIHELNYERYFLTCYDIVQFANSRGILCQGRGAAANSAVCYCLGITAVDPSRIDLLFERFVSRERNEPPDIDIDFEHERREEVIQYLYQRFGRERCGLTAAVISYRTRSAIREVAGVLGFPRTTIDRLTKLTSRWDSAPLRNEDIQSAGLDPSSHRVQMLLSIVQDLRGFPRHLSQHVGGFVITQGALCELTPISNAAMEERTIIEWDKDDIEALGLLKIDILALGMLTCIRKALDYVNSSPTRATDRALTLATVPAEDPQVYDMLCCADTIGVFQIESRAQMSMLPRLKPRQFYDLVIEVAIVRPGPIQGNMVHPFLRRRSGAETVSYPDQRVEAILGKTLGVPLFQEQAMRLCIALAGFTAGEAEQLRRAMAAWKRSGSAIEQFRVRVVQGAMQAGYSREFAETCFQQIRGFSEYGFPESHAASFALLVYVSAWLKRHAPAEFAAALLNSQPMGFYQPSQIISDLQRHGGLVAPIDILHSSWDHKIEYQKNQPTLRLGFRMITGLPEDAAQKIVAERLARGPFRSLRDLWNRTSSCGVHRHHIKRLAQADALRSLGLSRTEALWELRALPDIPAPFDAHYLYQNPLPELPSATVAGEMVRDYATTQVSLRAHPLQFHREKLRHSGARSSAEMLNSGPSLLGARVLTAGVVTVRQRPGTAKGVMFITLEDEHGTINVVVRPRLVERYRRTLLTSQAICVRGVIERVEHVIYVSAHSVSDLPLLQQLSLFSRDFQ